MIRDKKIDIAKALGIILVVLGHAGMPYSSVIFRFHMALFFALSGYCFSDRHIQSLTSVMAYIRSKICSLYIPFVLFNGITLLLRNWLISINIYTDNEKFLKETWGGNVYGLTMPLELHDMKPWIENVLKFTGESQLGGATWFLRVLFGITILWALINYILKTVAKFNEKECLIINVIISGISLWVAYNWMKNDLHYFMQFETVVAVYPIYTIGYYMKKHYKNKTVIQNMVLCVISFVVLIYADSICFLNGWNSNVNDYANPLMYILTSVSGIVLVLSVSEIIGNLKWSNGLTYIGKHTLAILLWHFLSFKIVTLIQCLRWNEPMYRVASFPVFKSTNGWWMLYTIVGVGVPIIIVYLYITIKNKYLCYCLVKREKLG